MSTEKPSHMLAAMVLDTSAPSNIADIVLGFIGSAERAGIRVVKAIKDQKYPY
jgi:hypothetical protein